MSRRALLAGLAGSALAVGHQAMAAGDAGPNAGVEALPAPLTDDEIRVLLSERIEVRQASVGMVVGVIEPDETGSPIKRVVAEGRMGRDDPRPVDADTLFEIGSITKVFTALLLADMAITGEVSVDEPVEALLPPSVRVPSRRGRSITLADLASHRSSLPRMPTNFYPADPANPYADYRTEHLYQFLATYRLPWEIDSIYSYSNVGFGLLGHALACRAGAEFETLLRDRVIEPLGLSDTAIALSPAAHDRLAAGHNEWLTPVSALDFDVLAGCGAVKSTASDLLGVLSAHLGYHDTPLAGAIGSLLQRRRPTDSPSYQIGLGWHIFVDNADEIIVHNGKTGGYYSWAAYRPAARSGVIVLSNSNVRISDIGSTVLLRRRATG